MFIQVYMKLDCQELMILFLENYFSYEFVQYTKFGYISKYFSYDTHACLYLRCIFDERKQFQPYDRLIWTTVLPSELNA